jgi:hypothetical protein
MTIVVTSPRNSSNRRVVLPDEFFVDDDGVDEEVPAVKEQQQKERQLVRRMTPADGRPPRHNNDHLSQHRGQSIEWRDVCMNVKLAAKKKKRNNGDDAVPVVEENNKKILDHVWGGAKAGELSAIMGASGALLRCGVLSSSLLPSFFFAIGSPFSFSPSSWAALT